MERGPAREAAAAGQQAQTHEWSARAAGPRPEEQRAERRCQGARARVPALFHAAWRRSVRRGRMGDPLGGDRQREGQGRLRAARRRDPEVLVAAGHQHRRLEVLPRPDRRAGARAQRQAADRPRRRHDHAVGEGAELLRQRRRAAVVQPRAEAPARLPEGGVQQPGLVQLRLREGAAVLGLLHQLGAGHDGLDPDAGQDRGHAVQVRLGHRQQPVGDPLVEGAARRRRHGVGPGVVHEGLRRVCRRHQVGRQDAARGEDGHPQRRSSRHRRVHQLQGRGREEGVGAHRRRLRRLVHRRGLRLGLLPELEQQRARDRRLHARGAGRRRVDDEGGARRRADGHLQGARPDARHRRGHVGLRRPGHAVRHHRQRVAHLPEHGPHQRQQPVLGVHVPGRLGVQPGVDQPDEVRQGRRRARRRRRSRRRAARSSRRRRSSSRTRAIRPRRSRRTATTTGRSASATPTSARC